METGKPQHKQIFLRPATVEDAPTILAITRAAFEQFRDQLDPPSGALHETLERLIASAFQPDHGVTLAFVEGTPAGAGARGEAESAGAQRPQAPAAAGVLRWSISPQRDHLYVGRVAVLPAYRHQGIASALMCWADAHARTLGLPAVQFGVRLQAPENIRFYQHLGYQIIEYAQHAGYDHPTFVWMRKKLAPSS